LTVGITGSSRRGGGIAEAARRLPGREVRVLVLGSAVKGEELPGSGLDVLIVSGEVPERHPIEFRLATPGECEKVRRVLLDGCEGF